MILLINHIIVTRVRSVTRELDALEYEVSVFGGYEDERGTSEDVTETMLSVMQVSPSRAWTTVHFII